MSVINGKYKRTAATYDAFEFVWQARLGFWGTLSTMK